MNPTELLVKKFSTLEDINGEVVPVSYKESAKIAREIEGEALLMMGLAAGRKEISLERFAWNERKASIPDNDGVLCNGEKIDEEGEERLETTVDIIELEKRIKKGDTIEFSHTLSSIISDLLSKGFIIDGFYSDYSGFEPLDSFVRDSYLAFKAIKVF